MKRQVAIALVVMSLCGPVLSKGSGYLKPALQAAQWIRASAVRNEKGLTWPADPKDPKSINTTLYSGSPGVVLFFIEAYRATGDKRYLLDAEAGADYLIKSIDSIKDVGLYTGLAGIGYTLEETYKATGEGRFRQGALRCATLIQSLAVKAGSGIEWSDITDIIGGAAGTGLFMIYAAREFKQPAFKETARLAALRLIELGRPEGKGIKWAMSPKFPRLMPNFSHGTAGIAYFLASVFAETKERKFLDAALLGAEYLLSVARTEGDVCMVFHNEPDGRDLYYLGWCHGPVGTARLFYQLYKLTGDKGWMEWVRRSAKGVLQSGIPETKTPGFWNNVSQCCGSAGVADFFLSLYLVTKDKEYLSYSKRVASHLLSKATIEEQGARWVQAEHRVRPELLVAQTGYMQGASGVGMLLLRLDSLERGKPLDSRFPDTPF